MFVGKFINDRGELLEPLFFSLRNFKLVARLNAGHR